MNRRRVVQTLGGLALLPLFLNTAAAAAGNEKPANRRKVIRSEEEWRRLLTEDQYHVLREEGTERSWTSSLNEEKRAGRYLCIGCEQPLFTSVMKFDSGTGWPSFFEVLEGAVETRRDFKLFLPRTEYHCGRCGGHHGHVFKDGPKPTGLRYCNNGVVLKFVPDSA